MKIFSPDYLFYTDDPNLKRKRSCVDANRFIFGCRAGKILKEERIYEHPPVPIALLKVQLWEKTY